MRILNRVTGSLLCENVTVADTFLSRLKGLLGRKELKQGEGLLLPRCSAVHTMFMSIPIDVIFFLETGEVLAIHEHLGPWKLASCGVHAASALELPAGVICRSQTVNGHFLDVFAEKQESKSFG